mmetsp:Transcript_19285/g.44819  ORF Transcript_19285/g.44819 Transcript_19285/m.44819 type:complete len:274 (-) Transcript_19285:59-880(-)
MRWCPALLTLVSFSRTQVYGFAVPSLLRGSAAFTPPPASAPRVARALGSPPNPTTSSSSTSSCTLPPRPQRAPGLAMSSRTGETVVGPGEVLRFWFGSEWFDDNERMKTPEYQKERSKVWFKTNVTLDTEIRETFGATIRAALAGELTAPEWNTHPGMVAKIVLMDQFCRNAFRGSVESFAGDALTVPIVRMLIDQECHKTLPPGAVNILSLPLMHSESLADHQLLEKKGPTIGMGAENLEFAKMHKDVIDRFGRYPHRNAQFNRESTPEVQP